MDLARSQVLHFRFESAIIAAAFPDAHNRLVGEIGQLVNKPLPDQVPTRPAAPVAGRS